MSNIGETVEALINTECETAGEYMEVANKLFRMQANILAGAGRISFDRSGIDGEIATALDADMDIVNCNLLDLAEYCGKESEQFERCADEITEKEGEETDQDIQMDMRGRV